jgi:hypothetical protein
VQHIIRGILAVNQDLTNCRVAFAGLELSREIEGCRILDLQEILAALNFQIRRY